MEHPVTENGSSGPNGHSATPQIVRELTSSDEQPPALPTRAPRPTRKLSLIKPNKPLNITFVSSATNLREVPRCYIPGQVMYILVTPGEGYTTEQIGRKFSNIRIRFVGNCEVCPFEHVPTRHRFLETDVEFDPSSRKPRTTSNAEASSRAAAGIPIPNGLRTDSPSSSPDTSPTSSSPPPFSTLRRSSSTATAATVSPYRAPAPAPKVPTTGWLVDLDVPTHSNCTCSHRRSYDGDGEPLPSYMDHREGRIENISGGWDGNRKGGQLAIWYAVEVLGVRRKRFKSDFKTNVPIVIMRTHRFGEGVHNLLNGPPDPYDPWRSSKLLHAGIRLKDRADVEIDSAEIAYRLSHTRDYLFINFRVTILLPSPQDLASPACLTSLLTESFMIVYFARKIVPIHTGGTEGSGPAVKVGMSHKRGKVEVLREEVEQGSVGKVRGARVEGQLKIDERDVQLVRLCNAEMRYILLARITSPSLADPLAVWTRLFTPTPLVPAEDLEPRPAAPEYGQAPPAYGGSEPGNVTPAGMPATE